MIWSPIFAALHLRYLICCVRCRACRSHPIIFISASFDPSSVRWIPHSLRGSSRGRLRYAIIHPVARCPCLRDSINFLETNEHIHSLRI